jgi:hypothetical protein
MIEAHLLRFIGGGLDGPLRSLPQESVARAKPALEADHPTQCRVFFHCRYAEMRGALRACAPAAAGSRT